MNHPDLDRLTSWVHGLPDPGVEEHVPGCPACRDAAEDLREEARVLSQEIGSPERLAALKAELLHAAGRGRPARLLLWQVPVAAAVLFGLVAVLLPPGARHSVVDGRVALEDGRVVAAPVDLAASKSWQLQAVEDVRVSLADHTTVHLRPGTRIGLAPSGARGVQADVSSGEARFTVFPDPKRLVIVSPAGRVEAADGQFDVKIVFQDEGGVPVKNALAGAIVTVFAGSISLSNANGSAEARTGQSAVLARSQAPLFLAAAQDKQEELLRRLEQLAARVAKLEDEVAQLEARNKLLKLQLASNALGAPGAAWNSAPGQPGGGVRVIQSAGGTPGGGVIIELQDGNEKKPERKNPQEK